MFRKEGKTKYFLGLVALMGLVVLIPNPFSDKEEEEKSETPARGVAQAPLPYNYHLQRLTDADRAWLGNYIRENRCYGNINKARAQDCPNKYWPQGDSSFKVPYFNQIPPGTKAQVIIECNPNNGKFYTRVLFPNVCPQVCKGNGSTSCRPSGKCYRAYFKNPYQADRRGPFSRTPSYILTSPGAFNALDFTHFKGSRGLVDNNLNFTQLRTEDTEKNPYGTSGTFGFGRNIPVNELYFVKGAAGSRAREWRGTRLTNTILMDGQNGIFLHGSEDVNGFGKSKGCVRFSPTDAKGLYDLSRRIGTKNMSFTFKGYGPYDPDIQGPACSLSSEKEWKQAKRGIRPKGPHVFTANEMAQRSQESRESRNIFQRFFDLFRKKRGSRNSPRSSPPFGVGR